MTAHIAVCEKTPGNKLLVAYLTLEEDKIAAGAMQRELISDWSEFYDDLYRNADPATDARLNLADEQLYRTSHICDGDA